MSDDKWGAKSVKDPLLTLVRWVKARSHNEKILLACLGGVVVRAARHQANKLAYQVGNDGNVNHRRQCCCYGSPSKTTTPSSYCPRPFISSGSGFSCTSSCGRRMWEVCTAHATVCAGSYAAPPGLSSRTQELTALFLGIRLLCRYAAAPTHVLPLHMQTSYNLDVFWPRGTTTDWLRTVTRWNMTSTLY